MSLRKILMTITDKLHASEPPSSKTYSNKEVLEIVSLIYGFDGFISTYTEVLGNNNARHSVMCDKDTREKVMNRFYDYCGKMEKIRPMFENDKGNRFYQMFERMDNVREELEVLTKNKNRTYKNENGEII